MEKPDIRNNGLATEIVFAIALKSKVYVKYAMSARPGTSLRIFLSIASASKGKDRTLLNMRWLFI
jgi:hypothetical protein